MSEEKHCESCGKPLKPNQCVSLGSQDGGYRELCLGCCNAAMAEYLGADFEHADFEPMTLTDAGGVKHEFHFGIRFLGDCVALDAFEMRDGEPAGYRFNVMSYEPEEDPLELFGKLLGKMRRGLAQRHLERDEDGRLRITKPDIVRGVIDSDPDDDWEDRMPLIVVDGQNVTWQQLGRMLLTYEGFQLKMEIYDKSEER
jgi:hypothetical protein